MDCNKLIRRVCPRCGGQELCEYKDPAHHIYCVTCLNIFFQPGEPISHGLCTACFVQRMKEAGFLCEVKLVEIAPSCLCVIGCSSNGLCPVHGDAVLGNTVRPEREPHA